MKLSPVQDVFNQGDILNLKVTVPATNNYFGEQLNLFNSIGDINSVMSTTDLFAIGNNLNFIKGYRKDDNHFGLKYNSLNDAYELEINIKLMKVGYYSILSAESIIFQGPSKCNRYRLDTNIEGRDNFGKIYFTVE